MSTLTRNCIISSMIVGLWIACSPSPSLSPQARSNAVSDDDEQAYDDDLDATSEVLAEYDFDAEIDDWQPSEYSADADGTDQCICDGVDAGTLGGAALRCEDANAELRQKLNDARTQAAESETNASKVKTASDLLKDAAVGISRAIPDLRDAVTRGLRLGKITEEQATALRNKINDAETKLNNAKDKATSGSTQAASAIEKFRDAASKARDGLAALDRCPPDVATAKAKLTAAATSGSDGNDKYTSARRDAVTAKNDGATGKRLLGEVLDALPR